MQTMIEEIIRTAEHRIGLKDIDDSHITVIVAEEDMTTFCLAMNTALNARYQCSVQNPKEIEEFYERRSGRRLVEIIARPIINFEYPYLTVHDEACGNVSIIHMPEASERVPFRSAEPNETRKDRIIRRSKFTALESVLVIIAAFMLGALLGLNR